MLYSGENGNKDTFRGKTWQLPNKYWRACNNNGQQCTFKLYNEALRFSQTGKVVNEAVDETVYDDEHRTGKYISDGLKRQRTRYMPDLRRSEMEKLVANLKKQGYKASAKGPNLKTDATDKAIDMAEGVNEGPRQPGHRVSGKAPKSMPDRSAFDAIKPRSRVTIKTPQGQTRSGKAVMYNSQYDSWVLNMGGRHGTPGIATRDNVVKVSGGGKMNHLSDRPRTEGGPGSGPQKGGEEKSYKAWRTAADQPSSDDGKLRRLKKKYDLEKTKKYEETNRINEAGPPNLIGGIRTTTKRDMNFKRRGLTVPKGTTVHAQFSKSRPSRAYYEYEGQWFAIFLPVASMNYTGFSKIPSKQKLFKMSDDGVSITPTGKRVEPDGHGPDGSPSWMLAMELI